MKISYLSSTIAALALGITVLMAPPSYAILPIDSGSSERSGSTTNESNIALTIGKAIEKVASTISQVVSPQPKGSSPADKTYSPIPKLVCRVSFVYVVSFVPIVNWTFRDSKLIPIVTSMAVTDSIQSEVCS